jgi:hypothetical protein
MNPNDLLDVLPHAIMSEDEAHGRALEMKMHMHMGLNAGGMMAVPGGYPLRLLPALDSMLSGVIPPTALGVTAVVKPELAAANVHLALYAMPTASGGGDQALVAQADALGITSAAQSTIAISVPMGTLPTPYVVRLWVDGITGANADTISRDGSTAPANEPAIPSGVLVYSVSVQ